MSHTTYSSTTIPALTIGLDLGDRLSQAYAVDAAGTCVEERAVATTAAALTAFLAERPPCRVVLEVGTHSPWISRLVALFGHEVFVANPSAMYGARRRRKRNDRLDAEFLARQGRADVRLLYPIQHRSAPAQQHLEVLRARDQLVRTRTAWINHVRGAVKALGTRLPAASAEAFPTRADAHVPDALRPAVLPLLTLITTLTTAIRSYDAQLEALARTTYPETARLRQIAGDRAGVCAANRGADALRAQSGCGRVLRPGATPGRKQYAHAAIAHHESGRSPRAPPARQRRTLYPRAIWAAVCAASARRGAHAARRDECQEARGDRGGAQTRGVTASFVAPPAHV